jgi:hypothetical protein
MSAVLSGTADTMLTTTGISSDPIDRRDWGKSPAVFKIIRKMQRKTANIRVALNHFPRVKVALPDNIDAKPPTPLDSSTTKNISLGRVSRSNWNANKPDPKRKKIDPFLTNPHMFSRSLNDERPQRLLRLPGDSGGSGSRADIRISAIRLRFARLF